MSYYLFTLAAIFYALGYVPYIWTIVQRKTKPVQSSWIIWSVLDTIVLAGMWFEGTANGQILMAVLGGWFVVGLTFWYGTSGWTKIDKLCLVGAVLGIALWLVFRDPLFGIMTSLSVVLAGSVPTFVSSWQDPTRENRIGWALFWVSCVVALIAIPRWTLADAAQPIVFFAIQTIMMYLLFVRPVFRVVKV